MDAKQTKQTGDGLRCRVCTGLGTGEFEKRSAGAGAGDRCLDGAFAGSVLRSQGTLGPAKLSRYRAKGIRMSTFLCSLRPDPAAAGLLGSLSLNGGGLIVAVDSVFCGDGAGVLGTWRRWGALGVVRRSECPNGAPHV